MKKALIFNISKKLSQLHRVIQLFQSQVCEIDFQQNFLREVVGSEIDNSIQEYIDSATEINNRSQEEAKQIASKIDREYGSYMEKIANIYNNFLDEAKKDIVSNEDRLIKHISEIKEELNQICIMLENKSNLMERVIQDGKNDLEKQICSLNEKFNFELKNHDKDAEDKIRKLMEQNEDNIKNINDQHKKDLEELSNLKQIQSEDREKARIKIKEMKEGINNLAAFIRSLKNNVHQTQTQFIKSHDSNKSQISDIIKELNEHRSNTISQKSLLQKHLEKLNSVSKAKLESLETQYDIHKQEHQVKLDDLQKLLLSNRDKYKKLQDDKNKEISTQYMSFDNAIKDLLHAYENEISSLRKKHETYVCESKTKHDEKHREIIKLHENQIKERNDLIELSKSRNNEYQNTIQDQRIKLQQEVERENKAFEELKKQKEIAINNALHEGNSETSNLIKQLDELKSRKESKTQSIKSYIETFDKEFKDKKNELECKNSSNFELTKSQNNKEYNDIKNSYDNEYQKLIENNKKIIRELQEGYQEEYNQQIDKIKEDDIKNTELVDLDTAKMASLQKQQEILASYDDFKIDNSNLAVLDREIEALKVELQEVRQKSFNEEQDIRNKHEEKMKNEKERHKFALSHKDLSGERQVKIKEINDKILEESINRKSLEKDIKDKIEQQKQKNALEMESLLSTINNLKDNSSIEILKNHYSELNDKLQSCLEQMETVLEEEKRNHTEKINSLKVENKENKDKLQQECDEYINNMIKNIGPIKAEMNEIDAQLKKDSEELLKKFASLKSKEDKEFGQLMNSLNKDIDVIGSEIEGNEKIFKQKLSSDARVSEAELSQYITERNEEIEKLMSDVKGILEFYEEKISVLVKRRNEARSTFAKQPSRESEVRLIDRLQNNLQIITNQLQQAVKDLTEYRIILVSKESVYNKKFGRTPRVGILSVGR